MTFTEPMDRLFIDGVEQPKTITLDEVRQANAMGARITVLTTDHIFLELTADDLAKGR